MTVIYFVRHATPDRSGIGGSNDATFPLSEKGLADVELVTAFLQDKKIDVVLSSPFKRSYDTVADFAKKAGLTIEVIDDFRERMVTKDGVELTDFFAFGKRQWEDFSHKLPDGECLDEVKVRNIAALDDVLIRYKDKNIAVGTHGTALSMIIHHYDSGYGYDEWKTMPMPWIAKLTFDGANCVGIEKIDLFQIPPSARSAMPRERECSGIHSRGARGLGGVAPIGMRGEV